MHKKLTFLWFVLGLGGKLQVIASLSITEIIVLVSAPLIFIKNYQQMRRDGVMPFFIVSLLMIFGCVVASIANKIAPQFVLRGMAVTCIISCSIIFSHWILRNDPSGFKWMFLGGAISGILSTFVMQSAVELTQYGDDADAIMSGPIYWIQRLGAFVYLPSRGWYLQIPMLYNIIAPLFMAAFSMLTTVSGRSAALVSIAYVALVIIGGRKQRTMVRLSRHFWGICGVGILAVFVMHAAYRAVATKGWLGEESRVKYEIQSQGENSIGRLILGGRAQSFVGLLACRDKPIVGWGPWAIDTKGYREEFMMKYGTMEDVIEFYRSQQRLATAGVANDHLIPCHAYITEFWLWYGIAGLIFWIYVMFVLLRYLRQDAYAVPQWFAWLACSVPGMFWGILFSPFADRFGVPLFVVACLMARAVRKGLFSIPEQMVVEIERANRQS